MHQSVIDWGDALLTREWCMGKNVLEVGSYDVNGSLRKFVERHSPATYTGIDAREGRGVDRVLDAVDLGKAYPPKFFDLVICTEMLEHAKGWFEALSAMWFVLKVGGKLMLTTRGPGFPIHDYPSDHWRFSKTVLMKCFPRSSEVVGMEDPDLKSPGVFIVAWKLSNELLTYLPAEPIQ